MKFTKDGDVTVAVRWNAADSALAMSVADTGCGIPQDRLAHIFNSFEQADAGTTRRYGGTGLGLAISLKLSEMMGGGLTVDSVVGEGSTFTVTLPVKAVAAGVPAEDKARRVADADALKGRRILAADDHAVNRRILSLLLEPHGCILTLVENGAEAVAACEDQVFDAILMDMQMPVMDGLDASRSIRSAGANRRTPLIALTANAMDVHPRRLGRSRGRRFPDQADRPGLAGPDPGRSLRSGRGRNGKRRRGLKFSRPALDPKGPMQQKALPDSASLAQLVRASDF